MEYYFTDLTVDELNVFLDCVDEMKLGDINFLLTWIDSNRRSSSEDNAALCRAFSTFYLGK